MTVLTEPTARAIIAPWYSLFNVAGRGDVKANFANTIPDMKFDIKEVLVAGDRVIVRGEVTGTPAGELFGMPHSGNSFRIMAVDIQTTRDGRIAKTFHMEDWLSAIGQLRAK